MKLLDRMRSGLVGAALRHGVEGGVTEVTKTRARGPDGGGVESGTIMSDRTDVGLPVGETSLKELEEQGEVKDLFGISIEEMRVMAGIKNPYAPATLDTSKIDFGQVEAFRKVRNSGSKDGSKPFDGRGQLDEDAARAAMVSLTEMDDRERAERAANGGFLQPDDRRRISGRDLPEADLDDDDE